ncbi:MAG: LemA family protein [Actinomycetota bacterium]|nr:LemA family protein [Actinomycetota bacterium]
MVVIVVVIAVGIVIGLTVLAFNGLVRRRNQVDGAWSQITVQLKRRYDLIPNLVETVKGYAAHERGTFEAVTAARAGAMNAQASGDPARTAEADNVLTGTLKTLFAVSEAYPQLKANQNFLQLQGELSSTEDRVAASRQAYNEAVLSYDTRIQTFPGSLIAGTFHFIAREYFTVPDSDLVAQAPTVRF